MAAVIEIDERNGAGEVRTHNISNSNFGSIDQPNIANPDSYPITPGNFSFEKWQTIHVVSMGGSLRIQNFRIWRTGDLTDEVELKTNAKISDWIQSAYQQPTDGDSGIPTEDMPADDPGANNVGIGGDLAGYIDADDVESDMLVIQIRTGGGAREGTEITLNYQYDEIL